ncbi:MAG: type II toxin-antitoxin system HigB family toxin [Bradyrhizobium sp.]
MIRVSVKQKYFCPHGLTAIRASRLSGKSVDLVPTLGTRYFSPMRVIARNTLVDFWSKHPEAKVALERWHKLVRAARWASTDEVQRAAPKSKVLNSERVRFEVAGGNYRLVVAFDFRRQVAFVKFIGTHADCDRRRFDHIAVLKEADHGHPANPNRQRSSSRACRDRRSLGGAGGHG